MLLPGCTEYRIGEASLAQRTGAHPVRASHLPCASCRHWFMAVSVGRAICYQCCWPGPHFRSLGAIGYWRTSVRSQVANNPTLTAASPKRRVSGSADSPTLQRFDRWPGVQGPNRFDLQGGKILRPCAGDDRVRLQAVTVALQGHMQDGV